MRRLGRLLASCDHKIVAAHYAVGAAFFLAVGFVLVALLRFQLAFPEAAIPGLGVIFGHELAPASTVSPVLYNQLGAMHGTVMVFLAVVPLLFGGFGGYLVPLMIGARSMALPRLHRLSCHLYLAAGAVMLGSFVAPGGAAQSGWTSYPPLSHLVPAGQTLWLLGMLLLGVSSVTASLVMITTVLQLRCPGLTWMRLPFFVWAQLVTAFLLLLAFPPLLSAAVFQLTDRLLGSSIFLPSGLVVAGEPLAAAGGGSPLLWQHLFWFLAHPEVYVILLPGLGIVAEVLTSGLRRPLWGYRTAVASVLFLGFVSFLVWAHHMFLTGMGPEMSTFFQVTTMIVSVPSVVVGTCLLLTLWGGRLERRSSVFFALAFLPMFGIGGATGLPLGLAAAGVHLHDTYYVVGHFHYVAAPGTLFAIFAGLYHWWPKITGRRLDEKLGRWHFWPTLVLMNAVFLPMLVQGLGGVHRRLWDGGRIYEYASAFMPLHVWISSAAWLLGLAQLPLLYNLWRSLATARGGETDPWRAGTLEWSASSPPPVENFAVVPLVERGPYAYDEAGGVEPQSSAAAESPSGEGTIPHATAPRPDTGLSNKAVAGGLGAAALLMYFGGLFCGWILLRSGDPSWPEMSSFGAGAVNAWLVVAVLAAGFLSSLWLSPGRARVVAGLAGLVAGACLVSPLSGVTPRAGEHPAAAVFFAIALSLALLSLGQAFGALAGDRRQGGRGDLVITRLVAGLSCLCGLAWAVAFFVY